MMFPWIPLACAALHLTEEFAWPGGFIAWYRWYRSDYASAITRPYIVGVNALLIGLTIVIGMLGDGPRGAALRLAVAALLGINGLWHLQATVRGRRYSPGVATGMLLYVPMAVGGICSAPGARPRARQSPPRSRAARTGSGRNGASAASRLAEVSPFVQVLPRGESYYLVTPQLEHTMTASSNEITARCTCTETAGACTCNAGAACRCAVDCNCEQCRCESTPA